MSDSVCIIDFNGYTSPGHFPVACRADWNPITGVVAFGGDWGYLPPMYSETEPEDVLLFDYAEWREP